MEVEAPPIVALVCADISTGRVMDAGWSVVDAWRSIIVMWPSTDMCR